jgi:hypothetical protein
MKQIPIYKAEKDLGLSDKILSSASICYNSVITPGNSLNVTKDLSKVALATNLGQVDLFYFDAILTSIGWNLNDDILDKKEVWIARATAEDKPLNLEHNPRNVIGHIVDNYAINDSGDKLSNTCTIDELPDKYHVVSSSVIYRFINSIDKDLEKEVSEILASIPKGEWYVSMEALFTNFDYGVKNTTDDSMRVIARDEKSAFLTKYLRAYGGDGVYQNYKIGRLIRNLTFSGKGLVKNPANPESIIFNKVSAFSGTVASVGYIESNIKENKKMDENVTRINSLEASLKAEKERNDSLQKRIDELSQSHVQAKISAFEADIKGKEERIVSLSAQVDTEQKSRISAENRVKELETSLAEATKNLDSLRLEQTKAKRVNAWVSRTGIKPEEAEVVIVKFNHLDEITFNSILELQQVAKSETVTQPTTPPPSPADVINHVKQEPDAALVTKETSNSSVELTRSAMAKLFASKYLDEE